jgi:sugar/nucleoside kinase (ribokinase family)
MNPVRVLAVGVHVLDVHVRHVESIPEGSDGQIVDQIRMSPAGTAGGTAVVLSRLGAEVHSAGALGSDPLAGVLRGMLEREGVDTTRLVTRDDVQTSASVLPVRPNGDRPAWHCIGANGTFTVDDLDLSTLGQYDVVHLGGPEFLGGEAAGELLKAAREAGATTSVDLLAPGDPDMLEWVAACLPHADHLLPNDEQLLGFTGRSDLGDAARVLLERGVGCVAVTCGSRGSLVATPQGVEQVPAFEVDVVDTTGCGDAFSAGFLLGVAGGRTPVQAAVLGNATAAQVVGGVGTDAGSYDLASVDDFANRTRTRSLDG